MAKNEDLGTTVYKESLDTLGAVVSFFFDDEKKADEPTLEERVSALEEKADKGK